MVGAGEKRRDVQTNLRRMKYRIVYSGGEVKKTRSRVVSAEKKVVFSAVEPSFDREKWFIIGYAVIALCVMFALTVYNYNTDSCHTIQYVWSLRCNSRDYIDAAIPAFLSALIWPATVLIYLIAFLASLVV